MKLQDGLPPNVAGIVEFLAGMAKAYDNHLKWNEQALFKADLMTVPERWRGVDVAAFAAKCRAEGMRTEDTAELVDWLKKAQAGRKLIPQKGYRGSRFRPDPEPLSQDRVSFTNEDW